MLRVSQSPAIGLQEASSRTRLLLEEEQMTAPASLRPSASGSSAGSRAPASCAPSSSATSPANTSVTPWRRSPCSPGREPAQRRPGRAAQCRFHRDPRPLHDATPVRRAAIAARRPGQPSQPGSPGAEATASVLVSILVGYVMRLATLPPGATNLTPGAVTTLWGQEPAHFPAGDCADRGPADGASARDATPGAATTPGFVTPWPGSCSTCCRRMGL